MTMKNAIAEWVSHFPRRPTPNYNPNYQYQIKYAGTEETLVQGGSQKIWADGIRLEEGFLLECKFIAKRNKSPFVKGSQIPYFIRDDIIADVKDEFSRYAAVINDPHTPVIGLEVIINEPRAVPFFSGLTQPVSNSRSCCSLALKSNEVKNGLLNFNPKTNRFDN